MNEKKLKSLFRRCPICSSETGEILHTQHFTLPEGYNLPSSYDVVCCKKCGFVFADVNATQKDYDYFYGELSKYEDKQISSGGGYQSWDIERSKRVSSDLSNILKNKKSKILDIGCANGGLLKNFQDKGYQNLAGLDPSPACISNIRKEGFQAFIGSIFSETFDFIEQDFDCVILSHVLEHIYDLRKAMMKIVTKVKLGGIVYIEVPDASRYPEFYKTQFYYFDCEHINHFDDNSLKNFLVQFDLEYLTSSKKEISASTNELYPTVYIILKKINHQISTKEIIFKFNSTVCDSVVKYIEMSQKDTISNRLDEIAKSHEKVIVWGAGQNTLRLLSNTSLGKCNIIAFVDKDSKKQDLKLNDLTIYSPEILNERDECIIVSSALHSEDIVKEIKNMGLKNKVIVLN